MDQSIFNWLLTGFGGLIGFFLHMVWQEVKYLQTADKKLSEDVNALKVIVAGDYMKKAEFDNFANRFFERFDRHEVAVQRQIEVMAQAIDRKADKQ